MTTAVLKVLQGVPVDAATIVDLMRETEELSSGSLRQLAEEARSVGGEVALECDNLSTHISKVVGKWRRGTTIAVEADAIFNEETRKNQEEAAHLASLIREEESALEHDRQISGALQTEIGRLEAVLQRVGVRLVDR